MSKTKYKKVDLERKETKSARFFSQKEDGALKLFVNEEVQRVLEDIHAKQPKKYPSPKPKYFSDEDVMSEPIINEDDFSDELSVHESDVEDSYPDENPLSDEETTTEEESIHTADSEQSEEFFSEEETSQSQNDDEERKASLNEYEMRKSFHFLGHKRSPSSREKTAHPQTFQYM